MCPTNSDHLSLPKFRILSSHPHVIAVLFGVPLPAHSLESTTRKQPMMVWIPPLFPFLRYFISRLFHLLFLKIVVSCVFLFAYCKKVTLNYIIFSVLGVESFLNYLNNCSVKGFSLFLPHSYSRTTHIGFSSSLLRLLTSGQIAKSGDLYFLKYLVFFF